MGYFNPTLDILLQGPKGSTDAKRALVDTGSPYIIFDRQVGEDLGLRFPLPRRTRVRGAGGEEFWITFPDDGAVRLLLSDFVNGYCYWAPPVAFRETRSRGAQATPLLGFTGFLQYLHATFRPLPTPAIEIAIPPTFPGVTGAGRPPGNIWALPPHP